MENMKLYHIIAKYLKEYKKEYKVVAESFEKVIEILKKIEKEEQEEIEVLEIKILESNIISDIQNK